jgi:hypothetical protein
MRPVSCSHRAAKSIRSRTHGSAAWRPFCIAARSTSAAQFCPQRLIGQRVRAYPSWHLDAGHATTIIDKIDAHFAHAMLRRQREGCVCPTSTSSRVASHARGAAGSFSGRADAARFFVISWPGSRPARAFYDQLMPFLGLRAVSPPSDDFVYYVGGRTALALCRADPECTRAEHVETAPGIDHLCLRARRREDVDILYVFLGRWFSFVAESLVVRAPQSRLLRLRGA